MQALSQILDAGLNIGGQDFYKNRVPDFVYSNLKSGFGKRSYQQDALGRFIFYWNEYHARPKGVPTQLLFHMATGSGKTLIMAGLIIYLYERGYRNFLFFVNSSNIIEKTKDNFLNPISAKYLFAEEINIGNSRIRVKEVNNFQGANSDDINIVFSTIQGLHSKLNKPQENSLSYEDFEELKIVLISDEAHHINAETKKGKKLSAEDTEAVISWENTVNHIFNANSDNILLEFTATADMSIPEIELKYQDKLIFDYPLKEFRKDGYSKEVKVLQADLPPFKRALQGVLLSQYRRKIFEKYKVLVKPVILFKSKTIKDSQLFFDVFVDGIKNLKEEILEEIKNSNTDVVIKRSFDYFEDNNISLENLILEIQEDFSIEKLISVNSKDESDEKQLAVNSLENQNNEYRVVFAVDKLNEGWDVLNLFDIVRLYDTRDAKQGKPGKTTMTEAQLIGRGARYYPFRITEEQSYYCRKYDDDIKNELRICEELYYHSSYNPKYIQELNIALEEIGIKAPHTVERQLSLKNEFRNSSFYNKGFIFINEQKKYSREDIFSIKSSIIEQTFEIILKTGYTKSSVVFDNVNGSIATINRDVREYRLIDLGVGVIRKAINRLRFYEFSNLRKLLPNLSSISEFIHSDSYLGKIKLNIVGLPEQIKNLTPKEKLDAVMQVLESVAANLQIDQIEYKGTKEFKPYMLKDKIGDKVLNFTLDEGGDKECGRSMLNPIETNYYLDLNQKDWYVFNDCFGTSEEKLLVRYIDSVYSYLKEKYDEIYLVRNEHHFKVYNFEDGKPLEPDFVLFLTNKKSDISLYYQIFIEPKGSHLLKQDEWKEQFLLSLKKEHRVQQLWQGRDFVIWGLPFYNEEHNKYKFDQVFKELVLKSETNKNV